MEKFQHNIPWRDSRNAGSKAQTDVMEILTSLGYKNMYKPSKNRNLRLIQQVPVFVFLKSNICFFAQYPSTGFYFYYFTRWFRKRKQIAIIHDLNCLRGIVSVKKEIQALNAFDVVISHNEAMTAYLRQNGLKSQVLNLGPFGYIVHDDVKVKPEHPMYEVMYAGNLSKADFLMYMGKVSGIAFKLFGNRTEALDEVLRFDNVEYMGSYSPEELLEHAEGGWSLVWDGTSVETCEGVLGEYLKYNSPHKVSMSIVAERPIIIWRQAALADYVVLNKLGIAVDSLKGLKDEIDKVSDVQYNDILMSIRKEKQRLISGDNMKKLMLKAEEMAGIDT